MFGIIVDENIFLFLHRMEFDDKRFLTLVSEYPCLYDSHDPNYKNTESRQICWMDIGNELQCEGK